MELSQIGACLGVSVPDRKIDGFSIDSRLVKPGDLFFALKGEKFDGHDFLQEVAAKGAVAAVVDRTYKGKTCGLALLFVEDVTKVLQKLAQTVQGGRQQRIIAVTGSVGKSTTKEFIATLLAKKYRVTKTPGNSNSQVGMPLAILNDPGDAEFFVVEMGMEQAGEITRLISIAPPDIAVITNIGHQHQRHFPEGIEGIAAAKAEILSHPKTQLGVIQAKAMKYSIIQKTGRYPKKTFGITPEIADIVLDHGVVQQGEEWSPTLRLPFSETHFQEDFIAAAAVARLLDLSWDHIIAGARELKPMDLRFQRIERDGVLFINDCYNADPESMQSAIVNLPKPSYGGKTIAVFGEMTELGTYAQEGHSLVAHTALKRVDHLLCYGKGCLPMVEIFSKAGKPVDIFRDVNTLKETLFEISKIGDVVLIKGSRGNKLWQVLGTVQK